MTTFEQQLKKIQSHKGFIAALDQSGGSTPKALNAYGIESTDYANETEMFDLVHAMRSRMITSQAFNGEHLLGAILFEDTLDRTIEIQSTSHYLWNEKNIVPFLKIDQGLAEKANGVQLMKPITGLESLLTKAVRKNVFGTKMRSVIWEADHSGIRAVIAQQFDVAKQIIANGLVPIIEPEISIDSPQKAEAETILALELIAHLNRLEPNQRVMLKITLPEEDNLYAQAISHPNMLKVVALSGGYSLDMACAKLAKNNNVVASFSRVLTDGLSVKQSEQAFNKTLAHTIERVYLASTNL